METSTQCIFCAEPEFVDLAEIYGREFQLSTCCGDLHEAIVEELQGGCRAPWVRELLNSYGIPIRQIGESGGSLVLDYGISTQDISLADAKAFIAQHHAHHKPPTGHRFSLGCFNGPDLIGVCTVGRPVARMIDGATHLEVNRLAVRRDIGTDLTWNACSKLYAEAAKRGKRMGFQHIITYVLETEKGVTLKAAGWAPEKLTRGGSWNSPSRRRIDSAPTCRKVRWGKPLVKSSCRPAQGAMF